MPDMTGIPNALRECHGCGQECVEGPNVICVGCKEGRATFLQIVREMGLHREVLDSEFGDCA